MDPTPAGDTTAEPQASAPTAESSAASQFRDRFESLLPSIQREWPEVARHTLEATRGSFDTVVEVIARQTGRTSDGVKQQLLELVEVTGDQAHHLADSLRPLEEQLEQLLDDLNASLRPRIEKPVRERPLMALGIAAGVGVLVGLLLASGRRSA
jgi:ABC-type transporter Mla subunit MlaD